ncbi:hypothetical protein K438DRAFT_1778286 [Mycena galopus ATCC 62051]|nr:hypothetical protein K438DRAFT_1778286 [Mycena galopus ATCC 62051]
MSLPLPPLDTLTGCILLGTWAGSLLYMIEIIQSVYYFRHFEHDDWKCKTLVMVALVVDGISLVGGYICVYEYTITHAGDLEYLTTLHWLAATAKPIPLCTFATGVLAVLVQGFLVLRYWRFTQKRVVALFLSLGIIISFGSVFTCGLMLTLYPSFEDRQKLRIPMALWLLTEVVVDAGIASVLLWEFRKAREILTDTRSLGTDSALDRLTAVTIRSGAAAATLAGGGLLASVWDVFDNLVAFQPQCPEVRKAFLHDRHVFSLSDVQRRTRAADIDQLGHRRPPRYSSVSDLDSRHLKDIQKHSWPEEIEMTANNSG